MKTIEALGRKVKANFPEYSDLSDAEIGRRVKARYPGAYDDFIETGISVVSSGSIMPTVDYSYQRRHFENLTKDLVEYYNPHQGRLSSWWKRGKAEARTKLLQVLNAEQRLVLEQGAIAEEKAMVTEAARLQFETFVAQHIIELMELRLSANVIDHALAKGVDSATAIQINRIKALDDLELEKLERQSYIATREYKERKDIDNKARAEEYRIDHENISRTQQEHLELRDRATQRLFSLYDKRAKLEESDDPAKEHKLIRLNKEIRKAEDELDGQETGPVSTPAGENQERNSSSEDGAGIYTDSDSEGQE
jgi:hypothetical protein